MTFLLFWVFFAALFTQMRLEEAPSIWLRKAFGLSFNVAGGAALNAHHKREREGRGGLLSSLIRSWLLPTTLSVVFLSLFADANPVISRWIDQLDRRVLTQLLAPERVIFWMVAAIAIWGSTPAASNARRCAVSIAGFVRVSAFMRTMLARPMLARSAASVKDQRSPARAMRHCDIARSRSHRLVEPATFDRVFRQLITTHRANRPTMTSARRWASVAGEPRPAAFANP